MTDAPTRQTLLLRIRDVEDDSAWHEFVEIYTPLIFNYCRTRGLQEADASDVVQEVLKSVARAIQQFEYDPDKGLFRGWLYTVTRSKLMNFHRRAARQPRGTGRTTVQQLIEQQPAGEDDGGAWDAEYRRHVFHWAAKQVETDFTATTWRAFWRSAVEEIPTNEVAAELGLSAGAVYVAKSRVISRLRATVAGLAGDGDPAEPVP